MKSFAHGGDLGDVIYSLPTIRALAGEGGAEVVLYPDPRVREAFTVERAHNIGVLLSEQSYVRRWRFVPSITDGGIDYDFGQWRSRYDGYSNLARSQAIHFGVDPTVVDQPWLEVEHPAAVARVVVIRSPRYRQHDFPWLELARRYRHEAIVLGMRSEFEELFHLYGFAKHVETQTMAEIVRVIAGAELVITNQTAGYAIAEALKKTVILERYAACPNVDFAREGVYHGERIRDFLNAEDARAVASQPTAAPRISGVRPPTPPAPESPPIDCLMAGA